MWREAVKKAHSDGKLLGNSYKEINYEALVTDPKDVLSEVCQFLDIEFFPVMTELIRPIGGGGDAGNKEQIVSKNQGKYLSQLSSAEIKRIEEIVYPITLEMGYSCDFASEFIPLSSIYRQAFRFYDAWGMLLFEIKDKGMRRGLMFYINVYLLPKVKQRLK